MKELLHYPILNIGTKRHSEIRWNKKSQIYETAATSCKKFLSRVIKHWTWLLETISIMTARNVPSIVSIEFFFWPNQWAWKIFNVCIVSSTRYYGGGVRLSDVTQSQTAVIKGITYDKFRTLVYNFRSTLFYLAILSMMTSSHPRGVSSVLALSPSKVC